ncbi:MAG: CBS domain-containing protein [Corynebacterium marinum]|jgi:CBS domain-containing protein|uniref:CBS domain-containing protein n=1 Tax=Corynebacterium marinum TaxID=349751 RepID=A0A847HAA5_9CORY|nr:CBS domain-containing protein [Corynebacterium marinum]
MSEQTPANRAIPFLAAFNDIEDYLRELLDAKRSDNFRWMVDLAVRKHLLSDEHAVELKEFAELRNAITHGLYTEDMRPIAEPLPETVAEIERIRDLLRHPPTALGVLGQHEVHTFSPADDIRDALRIIRRTKISQFPIYEGGRCVGLLTTNTIARWVAADLDDNDHLDARSIAEVLDWAEENDRAVFLPKDALAQEVLDALTTPRKDGSLPRAGILTEHGHKDQRPIRVIGGSDIAQLLDAVGN